MNEEIRKYLEHLFENAPVSKKAIELKEELYANSVERFLDLTEGGMAEEDAYKLVINSIGDIKTLLASIEIEEKKELCREEPDKKYALLNSISVGLYILGAVIFLFVFNFFDSLIALMLTLLFYIIPICMSVYLANMKPRYQRKGSNVVEEFKEWQSGKSNQKEVRKAISGIIWSVTLVAYFLISFLSQAWYITWVLFIVGVLIETVTSLLFSMKKTN